MKRTVLITGIAGFIGSNIARRLVALDRYSIVGIDNFETGRRDNLKDILSKITFVERDITDESIVSLVRNVDIILHQAAIPSVQRSIADPIKTNHVNATGTLLLLEAARKAKIARFVFAASCAAYGETSRLPHVETMPTCPLSPYAVQKITGENYCRAYFNCFGMSTISLRYFNVFGPYQDPNSPYAAVVPKFIRAIERNEPPTIFGDGNQTRDFVFVDNVVNANILAMEAEGGGGETVNIASGKEVSINHLLEKIKAIMGSAIVPQHLPPQKGDLKQSRADISKAHTLIGYSPSVDVDKGLEETVAWFR